MDIENILYIIVIIVWVVVGFIKKNKKKEGRPSTGMPPVGETGQPDFSEVLEEILGKKPEEKKPEPVFSPVKPVKLERTPKPQTQPESLESISDSDFAQRSIKKTPVVKDVGRFKKITKSSISPKIEKNEVPEVAMVENNQSVFDDTGFDLQKAVIYSEIMKTPYQ